ncbi:hypothetical protein [Marinomonas lutimaris]|jgi:hypothetical protein|uniref:hypothetical protein n=1 Tax=Marinomonas lutimaris TaxID=2846746 RepID=UPI001CA51A61|nr:hypothetical protein [Marinomonas lutimaris]
MWTLLLWLNQKIVASYELLKNRYQIQRARRTARKQMMFAHKLPDYLRRDMGLPPYTEREETISKDSW